MNEPGFPEMTTTPLTVSSLCKRLNNGTNSSIIPLDNVLTLIDGKKIMKILKQKTFPYIP